MRKRATIKSYKVEIRVPQGFVVPVKARSAAEAKRKAKRKLKTGGWWVASAKR